jgi:predicted outer membrane repeat protein
MVRESRHRSVGSFLSRSRHSAPPLLEPLEVRIAPAGFIVDHGADDGLAGSLRYAINQANITPGFDTISITTAQPITLSSTLVIQGDLTGVIIAGPGSSLAKIQRDAASPLFGLFDIRASAGSVTLSNLELTGGHSTGTGGAISTAADLTLQNCWLHDNVADNIGGGVYTTANLTVGNSTFQNNQALQGGGVYALANSSPTLVDFRDCTFSGNQATSGEGGALATTASSANLTADFFDCTLANNLASGGVGGAYAYPGSSSSRFNYQGSLFAYNSASNLGGAGTLQSFGHNLSTDNTGNLLAAGDQSNAMPNLGTLGFYGGTTPTIPLLFGSPAIDAGTFIAGVPNDQRGVSRPQGLAPDIGAYEVQRLSLAGNDEFTNAGNAFSRGGTGGSNTTVFVSYGDVEAVLLPVAYGPGFTFTLSHVYASEGSYVVSVDLLDKSGRLIDFRDFEVNVLLAGVPTDEADEESITGPGVVTATENAPGGASSVTATLTHLDGTKASLIVAIVPTFVASRVNGSSEIGTDTITSAFDVRAIDVGLEDNVTIVFHYDNNNFDHPILRYFNHTTQKEEAVSTDFYVVDQVGKTITLVLDKNSLPGILDISGTVFTIAVPLTVSVSQLSQPAQSSAGLTPNTITVSTLERGGNGGGVIGVGGSSDGRSGGISSALAPIPGSSTFFVVASLTILGGPLADESFGDKSFAADRSNLLQELPLVPDSLITLPGPILTPGSAETPAPREPSNFSNPPAKRVAPTSQLDDMFRDAVGAAALDEVFAHFGDTPDESRADWHDMALAAAAVLAVRPAAPRLRRFVTNAPDER